MEKKRIQINIILMACVIVSVLTSLCIGCIYSGQESVQLLDTNCTEDQIYIQGEEEGDIIIIYHMRSKKFYTDIVVFHDSKRNVTCWRIGGSISCIPDYQLKSREGINTV